MKLADRTRLHYIAAVFWILLTVSLASWWLYFGLEESRQLNLLNAPEAMRLAHVQRMLVWEGATFIGLLLVGGIALLVSIRREQARQRAAPVRLARRVVRGVHPRDELLPDVEHPAGARRRAGAGSARARTGRSSCAAPSGRR